MKLKNTNTAIVSYEISIDSGVELQVAERIMKQEGACWQISCWGCPLYGGDYDCGTSVDRVEILKILLGRK